LIVADNDSDMYITGTYDTRWNNDILNPAFRSLTASDFEVVQLGYNPPSAAAALASVGVTPATVVGGQSATGTVTLSGGAPVGGAPVSLTSANPAATVPSSVTVPAGASAANFVVTTSPVGSATVGNITASYGGVIKSATLTVSAASPAALTSLTLNPKTVIGGSSSVGTVTLNKVTATAVVIALTSNKPARASVPANVTVPAGASSASFNISTAPTNKKVTVNIGASYGGVSKSTSLTIVRK
jgi:hypothetical protein